MTVLVSIVPFIVLAVLLVFAVALLASSVRVLREYQRGVVFRLGRLLGDPKGPGLFLLIPVVDRMVQVDLRHEVRHAAHCLACQGHVTHPKGFLRLLRALDQLLSIADQLAQAVNLVGHTTTLTAPQLGCPSPAGFATRSPVRRRNSGPAESVAIRRGLASRARLVDCQ